MRPPEIDVAVHRSLGELVAGMRNLQDTIRRMEDNGRRSDGKSEASRAVVHRRLDEVVDRVAKVESCIVTIGDDVAEKKPVTDEMKRWKLMGMRALAVTGRAAMALGGHLQRSAQAHSDGRDREGLVVSLQPRQQPPAGRTKLP